MNQRQRDMMVTSLKRNGYTNIRELTYGELQQMFPRYFDISKRVNAAMGEYEPPLSHHTFITPESVEYIYGLEHARSKMEIELYFEMMFHYTREHAITFFTDVKVPVAEEAKDQIRERYSDQFLDRRVRPMVTLVANEIFG